MTCETLEVSVTESPRNAWRQTTPGPAGWSRSVEARRPEEVLHGVGRLPRERARELPRRAHRARVPESHPAPRGAGGRQPVLGDRGQPSDDDQATRRSARRGARRPPALLPTHRARGRAAQHDRPHHRRASQRSGCRRSRHRADLPEQGPAVLGDPRSRVRGCDVPGLEPLGLRLPRWRDGMVRRAHPTARVHRDR